MTTLIRVFALALYLVSTAATAQVVVAPQGPPSKILKISLQGISMRECGSDRDCSHEPVAGWVKIAMNETNGPQLRRLQGGSDNTIWRASNHTLQCSPWIDGTVNEYQRDGHRGDGFNVSEADYLARNVRSHPFSYTVSQEKLARNGYTVYLEINLGNPHKDNDFASTGYHWLAPQNNPIQLSRRIVEMLNVGQTHSNYVLGPFQTSSDRCHEYLVVLDLRVE